MTDSPEPEKDMARIAVAAAPHPAGAATAELREEANMIPASAPTPKKETARISRLPNPPTGQMKKTGPLMDLSPAQKQETAVTVAPETPSPSRVEIPIFLCWGLLGISASILILHIWNYLS